MKKALSIILCLAMLMSTVPMSVFAAPQAVTTEDSALEIVSSETQKSDDTAELAEENEILITYSEGYRSKLIDGKNHFASKTVTKGEEFTIGKLNKPESRYESTAAGYVLDGNWTDGTNIYAPGSSFVPEADVALVPNVVPEGDGYEVTFSVAPLFVGSYEGPGRLFMAVGEELDLTSEMFTLTPVANCPIICWKNAATGEVVTSVSGEKDEVINLVVASNAKELDITLTSANEITKNGGSIELAATVEAKDGSEVVDTVTWAITGGDEGVATLEGNVLTAMWDGTVEVTATPDYDYSQAKVFSIVITGQVGYTVKYDKNTGADVEVPAEEKTKGVYEISTVAPVREGYTFGGWMLDGESTETVGATLNITKDTTLYAMWTKGGYFNDFNGENDVVNSAGNTVILTDGNHLATDLRYVSEFSANPADSNASLVLGGSAANHNDSRLDFVVNSGTMIDVSKSDKIVLGFRSDIQGALNFTIRYATKDENGEWIAPNNNGQVAAADNPYLANSFDGSVSLSGDVNTVYEFVADMSKREPWDGFLDHIRFGNVGQGTTYLGKTIYYEYIKIPGAQTVESIALDVEAPVAADVAYGLEAVNAGSDKYFATGITWEGADLLGNMYFDSAKAYTAKIEIESSGAYALSDEPHTVTVNGEEAKLVVEDGKYFVEYTFPATEDIGTLTLVEITLHEESDEGTVAEIGQVFEGRDFDLSNLVPSNIPTGMRWIGWSATAGGEIITEYINISEETEYFANYEVITEYDFSNKYHKNVNNVKAVDGIVSFDGAWTVVTPKSNDSKAVLTLDGMNVASNNYDFIEIIYDGSLEDANNSNKFNETFVPALKVYGADAESYDAVVVKAEPVIASQRVAYKYTYDISLNGKPEIITAIELAPYKGKPAWAVTSAKLVANTPIQEAVAITGIKAPETWYLPDVSVESSDNYEIVSVEWNSDNGFNGDGSYIADTEYTLTIVVKPATGYTIIVEDATIEGAEVDSAVLGDDGNLTVTKTYPATEALVEFTLSVADAEINVPDGTVKLVPVFTPKNEGETVEITTVTWEIVDNGPEGKSALINKNGVVTAQFDGVVTVRATSDYNPEVYGEATVTITNQVVAYTARFDANTNSASVTNMPEDQPAKLDYVLPKGNEVPVREGFIFAGWTKSPDSDKIIEKDYVTGDVTYYAKWSKDGYVNSFNSEGNTLTSESRIDFADGGSFRTDLRYGSELTLNTDEGYISTKLGGTAGHYGDYRSNLYVPAGKVDVSNVDGFVLGLRSDTAGSMPFFIRYATKDEYGSWIGPDESADVNTYIANSFWTNSVTFSGDVNEVVELVVDMSDKAAWDGFLDHIRFCINNHTSMLGATIYFEYFRALDYETSVVEIKDVVAPVAKASYSTNATAVDTSKYTITNVAWEGDLIYDYYFGGSTEYTVCVTVKGAGGYFVSDAPTKATINGKPADYEYNAETGELTLKYTFPATGVLESSTAYDLTLYGMDDNGNNVPEVRTIFDGDKFELGSYMPISVPAGKRWIGWSETEGATKSTVDGAIVVNGDKEYYAVFENLVEFDYSNIYHRNGTIVKNGTLVFENGLAVVTPELSTSAGTIETPSMNIDGTDFGMVEVYYSATIEATHDKIFYENIFSSTLKPSLKFSLTDVPNNCAYSGTLVSSERLLVGSKLLQKYTYDMTTAAEWAGNVAKLQISPYSGYPTWGVALIRLIPSTEISAVAEIEIGAPETWTAPDADASVNSEYEILSVEWSPEAETFAPSTEYTVNVTYKPLAGYKVSEPEATINGVAAEVVDNGDDTFTAIYTFEVTEALKEIEIVITGPDTITSKGRYIELDAEVVALDGSEVPVADVTWTIESVGTTTELATVSERGRVYPISNGTVIVTATSAYNPAVSATHEIEISNQADLVKVTFNKNTQADVTGMPEEVYVYGSFVPEEYSIKRDGFYFTGWSTDEDALEPSESFNITEDTVLYAKWGKGYEFNFNDAANAPSPIGTNTLTFKDGIGTLSYNNISKNVGQVFDISGLKDYELETSIYKKMEIRVSLPFATSFLTFFRNSDGVSNDGYSASYQTRSATANRNDSGIFQTVTVDYSSVANWTELPYLNKIRLDITSNSAQGVVLFDYIRIPDYSRTVKFDANGGLVPYLDGEVSSYKSVCSVGNIPLPADPIREGYDFLGWAKVNEADETTKLYNNKFAVSDDVTLYAIWGPEGSADEVGGGAEEEYSSSSASTSKGGTTSHPGHATYPNLGGGSIASTPDYTTKTPSDKTVSVPERPKDDGALAMGAGNVLPEKFKLNTAYDGRFIDVKKSNWFYDDVEKSFRLGLMNGKSAYEFVPDGTVTVAEAITVAARMNAIYYGRAVYGATGSEWYKPYVDYAISYSIITAGQFSDYKALATREQVADMFVKALPASWYPQKNMFSKIPDVSADSASVATILKLYNAGIFTGVDDAYNFKPTENIKRSELSAIINRVALPDSRLRVITEEELLAKSKVFTAEDLLANKELITRNCVDTAFKAKDGLAYAEPAKADPWIGGLETLFEGGIVNAEEFKTITVVIKPENGTPAGQGNAQMFFAFDGKYTESMAVNVPVPSMNEDGTMTFVHNMSSHASWAGEVTTLRFDPYNNATPFSIVSITFAP